MSKTDLVVVASPTMELVPTKSFVASAVLGALVATPTAYLFSGGSALGAVLAALCGAGILALARRFAGPRLWLLAALTLASVVIGGPILVTIGSAIKHGTGNAGFVGLLFVMSIAGQLVAFPLGVVTAIAHVIVARVTR